MLPEGSRATSVKAVAADPTGLIPKEKQGQTGRIGISATEDKVVQNVVREVLEAIYAAPGEAWCFQQVKILHRKGESHPTGNRALDSWR